MPPILGTAQLVTWPWDSYPIGCVESGFVILDVLNGRRPNEPTTVFFMCDRNQELGVYLSVFLLIGVFFVFHRFWSMRNVDILLLVLLTPGILLVYEGRKVRRMSPPDPTKTLTVRPASLPHVFGQTSGTDQLHIGQPEHNVSQKVLVTLQGAQPPVAASTATPRMRSTWTADQLELAGFAPS